MVRELFIFTFLHKIRKNIFMIGFEQYFNFIISIKTLLFLYNFLANIDKKF